MNAPDSPRLTCRLVRGWSAIFGTGPGGAPSGWGSGHVEHCPSCQEFFGSCADLDAALRAEASLSRVKSDGLERSIIAAVRDVRAPKRTRRSRRPLFALAGAGAAAAVAVVLVVRLPRTRTPAVAEPSPAAEAAALVQAAQSISTQVWGKVRPSAVALTTGNPLQSEIDSVYSDARGAVNFLAQNFLPPARTNGTPVTDGQRS